MKPKLAFCFRGICKDFNSLYQNYQEKLFTPLSEIYDIDYYLSTNKISHYINSRTGENETNIIRWDSILKYFQFKNKIILEENNLIFEQLKNFSNNLVDTKGGCWGETQDGWSIDQSKQTTFCAIKNLYSIFLLKYLIIEPYNRYIITRQDLHFTDAIDSQLLLNNQEDAIIPIHDNWGGYCDRFAILNEKAFDVYTNRIINILSDPIKYHEESYLKFHLDRYNISIRQFPNFRFYAVRAPK